MPKAKVSGKDAKAKWLKATPKQKRIWHYKNRIKAAEIRGESKEFIKALEEKRDEELKQFEE
jgi:hypothetical protein